jgi:hypothetical protein
MWLCYTHIYKYFPGATTLREVLEKLKESISSIYVPDEFPLSVISACELFGLFITLSKGDLENPVRMVLI